MNQQPSFAQYLTAWKYAVVGKPAGSWPHEIEAETLAEFTNWQSQLAQCKVDANNKGINCQFCKGGTPSSGKCAAWVIANDKAFKVVFNAKKQPLKKGVAATSIEKYHSLDTRGQTLQVAITAASLTKQHGFTTDSQVAQFVGIPSARVSARRNEIESIAGVMIMNVPHYFETAGRVKCPVTGSSVNGWKVVAAGQAKLFQD